MASIDLSYAPPVPSLRGVFVGIAEALARHTARPSTDDGARRDFVLDKLRENGDAFRSEADIQCMMSVYPCRF